MRGGELFTKSPPIIFSCQTQVIDFEPRATFFWSSNDKIKEMITSLIEMQEVSNFGHMTTYVI